MMNCDVVARDRLAADPTLLLQTLLDASHPRVPKVMTRSQPAVQKLERLSSMRIVDRLYLIICYSPILYSLHKS
jgi:hypothetical protein